MAFPLGRFNKNSLKVLKKIRNKDCISFATNEKSKNLYKISREDHTILFKKLGLN